VALKDLGFSLEGIGHRLENGIFVEQMRGMLKLPQEEIRHRVELWLRESEQEDSMSKYDVVIKKIEAIKVASVRGVVPTPPDQRSLWDELMNYLNQEGAHMIGPPMALYHDPEFKEHDWDIEVCMPIVDEPASENGVKVYNLPGSEKMACVVHTGPFAIIGEPYGALAKWIDQNGYHIVGLGRELNLRLPEKLGDQNDPNWVNEIQFPVEKT
jgi:effector-binding domain-containing protein